jgi:hypothetical protein
MKAGFALTLLLAVSGLSAAAPPFACTKSPMELDSVSLGRKMSDLIISKGQGLAKFGAETGEPGYPSAITWTNRVFMLQVFFNSRQEAAMVVYSLLPPGQSSYLALSSAEPFKKIKLYEDNFHSIVKKLGPPASKDGPKVTENYAQSSLNYTCGPDGKEQVSFLSRYLCREAEGSACAAQSLNDDPHFLWGVRLKRIE